MSDNVEERVPEKDERRLYKAAPRGIGNGWTNGCMCCGGPPDALTRDCAMFVPSRETGEAIVAMFKQGALLDYRRSEPNWIQVKIGVCDAHLPQLEALVASIAATSDRLDGPGISRETLSHIIGDKNVVQVAHRETASCA